MESRLIARSVVFCIKAILVILRNGQWKTNISLGELKTLERQGGDLIRELNGHY